VTIIDRGTGPPIVLIPSLQGRWEYLSPAVDALARTHRVITFSLSHEPGLDVLVHQVEAALDDRGVERAAICGISFGGRVALAFAARRPERTSALILVSVPGPRFRLRQSHRTLARHPLLAAPLFFAAMPSRLWTEVKAAMPEPRMRRAFVQRQLRNLLRAPVSPSQMGARALLIDGMDSAADCANISAPTLVIGGEPTLDYVVPSNGSSDYSRLIAGARTATLEGTGHLGSITKPDVFAGLVDDFLSDR
jgi:3-oxoadipate enol-lactonase